MLPLNSEDRTPGQELQASGRGFLAGDCYYLPTTSQLVQIDLGSGRIVRALPTQEPLGNLICYRDQVLSLGPESLTTYFRADRLQERVTARLQQTPDDPWALEQQALLWLDAGRQANALQALRRACTVTAHTMNAAKPRRRCWSTRCWPRWNKTLWPTAPWRRRSTR